MMTVILGILAYFIIGGIIVGIMTMIDDDTDNIGFIGILWPIAVPLIIGISIIAIVGTLVSKIAGFFINKKY